MSCNGCRVLRRECSEACILRSSLWWIETPKAQANATLLLSKFFGRSDLINFIAAVPDNRRPALFQSLLFEACGRMVNPVNGALGLLLTRNWNICEAAVETVLAGRTLRPLSTGVLTPEKDEPSEAFRLESLKFQNQKWNSDSDSDFKSKELEMMMNCEGRDCGEKRLRTEEEPKLLNLFV